MTITLSGDNAFAWHAELDRLRQAFITAHGDMAVEQLDGQL